MEILHSQAVLTVLGLLAVYFAIKLIALVVAKWTPRNRALTLDDGQLKQWRITAAMESAGMTVAGPAAGPCAVALCLCPGCRRCHCVRHV